MPSVWVLARWACPAQLASPRRMHRPAKCAIQSKPGVFPNFPGAELTGKLLHSDPQRHTCQQDVDLYLQVTRTYNGVGLVDICLHKKAWEAAAAFTIICNQHPVSDRK